MEFDSAIFCNVDLLGLCLRRLADFSSTSHICYLFPISLQGGLNFLIGYELGKSIYP